MHSAAFPHMAPDDPSLTVRLEDDTPFVAPLRVVLDPGLATVARGRVREGDAPTLYIHAPDAKPPPASAICSAIARSIVSALVSFSS